MIFFIIFISYVFGSIHGFIFCTFSYIIIILIYYFIVFCFVFIAYFRVNPCNPRFCRIKEIDALCCDFDLLDCLATYTVDAGNNAGLSLLLCGCIVLEVMLYCRYFIFYGEPFVFFSLVLFTLNFTSTLSFCSVR